jgi:hypothetical protein
LGRFRPAGDGHPGHPRDRRSPGRRGPLVFPILLSPSDLFQPLAYLEPCPSPRERPGNTKTDYLLGHGDMFQGGDGIFGNPLWPGVGIIAAWFAAGTCCSGNDRVALPSRCHGSLAQAVVTGSG